MPSSMPIVEEGVDPLEDSIDNFVTSVGIEAERIWARLKQRLPDGRVKEFDAVALAGDIVCFELRGKGWFPAPRHRR